MTQRDITNIKTLSARRQPTTSVTGWTSCLLYLTVYVYHRIFLSCQKTITISSKTHYALEANHAMNIFVCIASQHQAQLCDRPSYKGDTHFKNKNKNIFGGRRGQPTTHHSHTIYKQQQQQPKKNYAHKEPSSS